MRHKGHPREDGTSTYPRGDPVAGPRALSITACRGKPALRALHVTARDASGETSDHAVQPVTGVAEPGHDVPQLVEPLVEARGHDGDGRVGAEGGLHSAD